MSVYKQIVTLQRAKCQYLILYNSHRLFSFCKHLEIQVLPDNFCGAVNHKKSNIMSEELNKLLMMTGQTLYTTTFQVCIYC